MNTPSASRPSVIRARRDLALLALLPLAAALPSASADILYWGQTNYTGDVATAANWFTDSDGTNGSAAAPHPTNATDDLVFNTAPANTAGGTIAVTANFSARSLAFNTSGATVLSQDANRNLILGSGGITLGSGSGNVNIGINVNALSVRLAASQSWTNNSAAVLNVRNITTSSGAGPVTLTLGAAGAGNIVLPLSITDSVADPLSLVVDSTGAGMVTTAASAYRGGTTIKQGHLFTTGTLGTGAVLLGDTAGTANATLTVRSAGFANYITVRGGSSGAKTLVTNQSGGAVLNGAVTLDDTLALTSTTDGTFNGAITGVGSLVKGGNAALTFAGANTFTGDLTINSGAFTLAESGSFTFDIGANGAANQINGATAGAVAFNGTFNFDLSGASLVPGNSWSLVSLSATETYGASFSITGFTQNDNVWTNGAGLSFSEITGVLSYSAVPEPSSVAALAGFGTLLVAAGRRRAVRD